MKLTTSAIAIVALICLAPARSEATAVTFTNLALFQAAAGATVLEDFTAAAPFNATGAFGPTAYTGFSLTGNGNGNQIGVHSAALGGVLQPPLPASFAGQQFFGWASATGGPGTIGTLTFTFVNPIKAFGFDWFNTDTNDRYKVTVLGVDYSDPPFSTIPAQGVAATGFFGIVSDTPFTTLTISNVIFSGNITDEGFDNVRTSAAPVPEPATLLLVATGSLMAIRRKRTSGVVSR